MGARRSTLFPGGGEMGALIEAFDWASTPLGPIAQWPLSLRTSVQLVVESRFSMWMWWGPALTMFYNDAYRRDTLGVKHPWALGRPAREVWAEIWGDLEPRIRTVVETRTATWDEALLLFLERSGYREETYHTFSYSPIAGDDGRVAGMLCVVTEDTERVIGARRMKTLRELAADLASVTREEDVLATIGRRIGANPHDFPFTLTYLFDDVADGAASRPTARLACATGIEAGAAAAPRTVGPDDAGPWPAAELLAHPSAIVVDDLAARFGVVPRGAWDAPPARALVVPITGPGQERPAGFFVAALNPYRPVDAAYTGFVDLVTGQIASSLGNARAYEHARRRAEELAAIDRAKTQFFSNVSHEFRTPLTLLLGPAEDALADSETRPQNRERLALVHRNALRLLRLVNTLLDFSRIEAGRVTARYQATDLPAYTAELASSFRSAVERAGLRLVVDCPASAGGEPVYVDRDMWEKVVLNLVSNAFKHTFEGEIAVCVRVEHGRAVLEVRDTGVGIPADQLPHVFERFHRVANSRSRTHEGSGIGLALVQELVRLHGGTVVARSEVGVGTTFSVTVPTGTAHLPSAPAEAAAPASPAPPGAPGAATNAAAYVEEALRWLPATVDSPEGAPDVGAAVAAPHPSPMLAGARVLVADDNADMRQYVTRLLRERGFEVLAAADGSEALALARTRAPELVLSDVMMPGLDGFELLAALRADPHTRGTPIVLLSARAGEEARVEGMQAGADDYLVKPFSARELIARAEGHLRLARIRRDAEREQERLLQAVQAERTRLRELIAQAPAAIAVLRGPEHVYETANDAYRAFIEGRDIVGLPIRKALPELEGQGVYELLDDVYRTGRTHVGEGLRLALRTRDGGVEERVFTFVYQPIREEGAVTGIFVLAVDVTVQELARHEAELAREEAESANRAKADFLAAMSHELRTPLNAIGGHAELIELGIHGPVTDAQRAALARIRRSEEHLLALINDVLNFAKLEAGRVDYDIGDVSLAHQVADVAPMIEPQLAAKGITYVVRVDPDVTVRADAEKVRQILLNLLSNAVKFTPSGGRVEIDTPSRVGQRPDCVFLRVTDTGIGIPADRRESIFSPFVQAHRNLTRTTEGTGLGLAISRDLARAMGGELRVRSEEGRGSSFTLELPSAS